MPARQGDFEEVPFGKKIRRFLTRLIHEAFIAG